jgi:hypothetical protein
VSPTESDATATAACGPAPGMASTSSPWTALSSAESSCRNHRRIYASAAPTAGPCLSPRAIPFTPFP